MSQLFSEEITRGSVPRHSAFNDDSQEPRNSADSSSNGLIDEKQGMELIGWGLGRYNRITNHYVSISNGSSGSVWTSTLSTRVVKHALLNHQTRLDELSIEATIQSRVGEISQSAGPDSKYHVSVPRVYPPLKLRDQPFWRHVLKYVPTEESDLGLFMYALLSERIRPIPNCLIARIIQRFETAPNRARPISKISCLISLYLGCSEDLTRDACRQSATELLLNAHQLTRLHLPIGEYVFGMADGLALLHWGAYVDGRDVKFVLGRPRINFLWPTRHLLSDSVRGILQRLAQPQYFDRRTPNQTIALWMINFGKCKPFSLTLDGIDQLVDAYWEADPYLPRPRDSTDVSFSGQLWRAFRTRYLMRSVELMDSPLAHVFMRVLKKDAHAKRAHADIAGDSSC